MADWHHVSLIWRGRAPYEARIEELNKLLYGLDYDCPKLSKEGLDTVRWRSPLLSLLEFLDFLDNMGHPCQGRLTRYYDDDDWGNHQREPWTESTSRIHEKFAHLVKPHQTRFERINNSNT
jgi:hypothetical protein